jgi:RimJ/RimL family protein N-acetyltransferase
MSTPLPPVTLSGRAVRLEPLSLEHVPRLHAAASGDRETFGWTLVPPTEEAMGALVAQLLADAARGACLPFATVALGPGGGAARVVGATRFMSIERWVYPDGRRREDGTPDVVEIGGTWLAPAAQRTAVNTEAKWLMLRHAFEAWRVERVSLKTDRRNARSRAAIERIGARFDGVLRAHMPGYDGAVRDTAFYSIVAAEWPEVEARLAARIARA